MAIFSDLPIELLHRIVELAVEDAIAIDDDKLRRQILLKLSLVSKDFTLPSQVVLWRNIRIDNLYLTRGLFRNKMAEDKIVEELELYLLNNFFSRLDVTNLKIFLNRLYRVDSLEISNFELSSRLVKLDELLEIPSLRELKSLSISRDILINIGCDLQLPFLQHLTICMFTPENDDFFSKIIEASSNTLSSLLLTHTELKSYSSSKTLNTIKRHASRLVTLRVTNCVDQLPLDLFPHCVSLKSLALNSDNSFDITISALNLLPPSSSVEFLGIRLRALLYSFGNTVVKSLVGNEDFSLFIIALDLPQFRQLKYLYLDIGCNPNDNIGKACVKSVRERVDFIEKLEKRGIKLRFGTEKEANIREEKEKQRLYQERQMKLDSDLK